VCGARTDSKPAVPRTMLALVDPLQVRFAGVIRAMLFCPHFRGRRSAATTAASLLASSPAGSGHDERGWIQHLRVHGDECAEQRL
jgi:hypothetical protein